MVVHGLLVVVASLVAEYRLWVLGLQYLQNLGSVVVVHGLSCSERDMWKLPRPGIEALSPTLAGGFVSTVPPGKA